MLKARTCGHSAPSAGGRLALRSQLLSQAFQAWSSWSCSRPTSSLQATGTQRLRARVSTGPALTGADSAAGAALAPAGGAADRGTGAGAGVNVDAGNAVTGAASSRGKGGALPQATRLPRMASPPHAKRKRPMTLILLEALGAGLIFVAIVWWTMFSGRKNGELPPPPDSDDDSKPPKA